MNFTQRPLEFRVWHNFEKCFEECINDPKHILCINNGMPIYRLPLKNLKSRYPENPDRDINKYPFATLSHILGSPDFYSVTQFTGLLDKNGKKIFEGDIVKAVYEEVYSKPNEKTIQIIEVRIIPKTNLSARKYYGDGDNFLRYTDIEIIGNIFENPELLKS